MKLQELKKKNAEQLLALTEQYGIENASSMRKQEMTFAISKAMAEQGDEITGEGVIEVLQDGFGFLRSPKAFWVAYR
jgi:transcription termination factor Rho